MPEPAEISEFQRACEAAALAAGAVLLEWAGRFAVREKGPADLVTEADLASQEIIQRELLGRFPGHGFLAEENVAIASRDRGLRWIVDPLDGTTNYVHGLAGYAVSIALEQSGRILVGAVYDPLSRECYTAAQGRGSWLNGRRLRVSTTTALAQALVAISFPARVERGDPEIAEFIEVLIRSRGLRRMGSSALNLCYLAAGRFDAYWASSTKSWDIAAGALLMAEAGGTITGRDGGPLDLEHPQFIAASTADLHAELREVLQRARPQDVR